MSRRLARSSTWLGVHLVAQFAALAWGGQALGAQVTEDVGAESSEPASTQAVDLSVRISPGQMWRQGVDVTTRLMFDDSGEIPRFDLVIPGLGAQEPQVEGPGNGPAGYGTSTEWRMNYQLRYRCVGEKDGIFDLEAQFLDWNLHYEDEKFLCEWRDNRFRHEIRHEIRQDNANTGAARNTVAKKDEPLETRALLKAWSEGLREADLRMKVAADGQVLDFKGLEALKESVQHAMDTIGPVPASLNLFFGKEGLNRFELCLSMAVTVPRPAQEVEVGAVWQHSCNVPGVLPSGNRLVREFKFQEKMKERRHDLAVVEVSPLGHWCNETQIYVPVQDKQQSEQANGLQLLLEDGLVYRLDMNGAIQVPDLGKVEYALRSWLEE